MSGWATGVTTGSVMIHAVGCKGTMSCMRVVKQEERMQLMQVRDDDEVEFSR